MIHTYNYKYIYISYKYYAYIDELERHSHTHAMLHNLSLHITHNVVQIGDDSRCLNGRHVFNSRIALGGEIVWHLSGPSFTRRQTPQIDRPVPVPVYYDRFRVRKLTLCVAELDRGRHVAAVVTERGDVWGGQGGSKIDRFQEHIVASWILNVVEERLVVQDAVAPLWCDDNGVFVGPYTRRVGKKPSRAGVGSL